MSPTEEIVGNLPILVLGAGGHAQVIADTLRSSTVTAGIPLGFLDDNVSLHGSERMGIPVLGSTSDLGGIPHRGVVIGVGNNRVRSRIASTLQAQGEVFITVVHPRAWVAPGVTIGAGSVLFANVVVNTGSRVGAHVILNTGCTIDHHNDLGDYVHIAPGAHLGGDVVAGEGVFVGIGGIVMPQRKVGAWATVGAGALVHGDVPAGVTVVGVPARLHAG